MNANDANSWRAVEAALDSLLAHPERERDARLADLRARDAAVAGEVERLLAAQPAMHAQRFLEDAAAALMPTGFPHATETLPSPANPETQLAPGTLFGPYRLARVLGRGGMGIVYEADETESGRRVALKVLKDAFADERERDRFEREGRLAASISHPNCVFVFAATEVDGRPAIAMELMQRTLADRLRAEGRLSPAAAVDAVLQLVDGLRAAADVGVLHRDVKPSNCFVDADGMVKIGDFGISRSLRPTEETSFSTRGQLAATPPYAAPEQLRGEPLDARADIYSLGATLYELLTGRRPFEHAELLSLLTAVATEAPQPPHAHVPGIPRDLSRIVLRCLAKTPRERFADYASLRSALEPFSSAAPRPATLGRRTLAGAIDSILWGLPFLVGGFWHAFGLPGGSDGGLFPAADVLLPLAYFVLLEGLGRASPGKLVCGLGVVRSDGAPPGVARITVRAAVFVAALNLLDAFTWLIWRTSPPQALFQGAQDLVWLALVPLFATARRSNGYAGLHDLASGTRVVDRRRAEARIGTSAPAGRPAAPSLRGVEGFAITGERVPGLPEGWHEAVDLRLKRRVWMRRVPPGTQPVSLSRRAIGRPTRLRWLAGRRRADDAWDIYDAVAGSPLAEICAQRRIDWAEARWWMLDLAREARAGATDDEAPLRVDRIWIRDDGRAVLLDDPAIDTRAGSVGERKAEWIALLREVARLALPAAGAAAGGAPPCPLRARDFLDRLDRGPCAPAEDLARELESLTRERARTTRSWRALPIGITLVAPLVITVLGTVALALHASQRDRVPEPLRSTATALDLLEAAGRGRSQLPDAERRAIETALVSRYRAAMSDPRLFGEYRAALNLRADHQAIATALLERATPAGPDAAVDLPQSVVRNVVWESANDPGPLLMVFSGLLAALLIATALVALVSAAAFRGAVLRLAGLEIVRDDGRPASRLRVFWRTLVVWAPMLVLLLATVRVRLGRQVSVHVDARGFFNPFDRAALGDLFLAGALLVMLIGVVLAIRRPSRGIQDRLAGTWVVSR